MKKRAFIIILVMLITVAIGSIAVQVTHAADLLVSSFIGDQVLRYDQQTGNFINVFDDNVADVLIRCCEEPRYWIQFFHKKGKSTTKTGQEEKFFRSGAYQVLDVFQKGPHVYYFTRSSLYY